MSTLVTLSAELEARLHAAIIRNVTGLQIDIQSTKRDLDISWLLVCGAMVFFMQAGFAMLEAGLGSFKGNVGNVIFKNVVNCSIAGICFWLVGYGLAYGYDSRGFIGTSKFVDTHFYNGGGQRTSKYAPAQDSDGWEVWFIQWSLTCICVTIFSGSVADRCRMEAYFLYSIVASSVIYPVVVHWSWGSGWLSAWGAFPDSDGNPRPLFRFTSASNGMIDYSGSGVVHMVGGFSGFMGALVIGPRLGRFQANGSVFEFPHASPTLQALGTILLWFGWYGFNMGSTRQLSNGNANIAAKIAFNTTIAASMACVVVVIMSIILIRRYDSNIILKATLTGLVSISASCAVVDPWHACIIGSVGGILYFVLHFALLKMKIDDPCDACVVHGFGGFWGLLAPGLFCTDKNVQYAKYPNVNTACGSGEQFGVQVVGVLCITAWTVITTGFVFLCFHVVIGMRIKDQEVGEESEPKSNSEQGFSKRELSTEISRDRVNEKGGTWSPHTSQRAPITQATQYKKKKTRTLSAIFFMCMSCKSASIYKHVSTKRKDAYGFMYLFTCIYVCVNAYICVSVRIRFLPFKVCLMNTPLVFRITIQDMTELNLLHLSSLLVLHPRYVQILCFYFSIYGQAYMDVYACLCTDIKKKSVSAVTCIEKLFCKKNC